MIPVILNILLLNILPVVVNSEGKFDVAETIVGASISIRSLIFNRTASGHTFMLPGHVLATLV